MEMHQIRYFISVCQNGSFTRAAEECGISQPALTAAIKKLETELGDPLFRREGRKVFLSPLGKLMRPKLESVIEDMRSIELTVQDYKLLERVPLRLGIMSTIGVDRVSQCIANFQLGHPGVDLEIHQGPLEELVQKLQDDEINMAILSSPAGFDESYRVHPMYRDRYMVIFPPTHRLREFTAVRLADLSGENYVDRLACEYREIVMATCADQNIELYAHFRAERDDWIQAMVARGLGFSFMPEGAITHGGVSSRPLVEPEVSRDVSLVYMPGRKHSPVESAFIGEINAFSQTQRANELN